MGEVRPYGPPQTVKSSQPGRRFLVLLQQYTTKMNSAMMITKRKAIAPKYSQDRYDESMESYEGLVVV